VKKVSQIIHKTYDCDKHSKIELPIAKRQKFSYALTSRYISLSRYFRPRPVITNYEHPPTTNLVKIATLGLALLDVLVRVARATVIWRLFWKRIYFLIQ
jgi:hypothetical protein